MGNYIGKAQYSKLAGKRINTIDDLSSAITSGKVSASKVAVETGTINGKWYIINTRTATALERAGVPRSKWNLEAGFKKKSDTWYWSSDEVILVVNLQKSQYGYQYYINFGILLRELDGNNFPKEHQCHIRFRLESTVGNHDEEKYIKSILDLEDKNIGDATRKYELTKIVRETVSMLISECSSKSDILDAVKRGVFKRAGVNRRVRDLIE